MYVHKSSGYQRTFPGNQCTFSESQCTFAGGQFTLLHCSINSDEIG